VFEFVEYRRERRASTKSLRRFRIQAVGENDQLGVLGKQRDLTGDIAPICAISVGVDQFTNRRLVGQL
jgi:hypothetical protein